MFEECARMVGIMVWMCAAVTQLVMCGGDTGVPLSSVGGRVSQPECCHRVSLQPLGAKFNFPNLLELGAAVMTVTSTLPQVQVTPGTIRALLIGNTEEQA